MNGLTIITPQENFPTVDISDENADILEIMFQNQDVFETTHFHAEQASKLFKIGHKILLAAGRPHLLHHEAAMLNDGIATYEAISAIMVPTVRESHNTMLVRPHIEMAYLSVNENFERETESLPELFRNQRPNTSRVVDARARRLHGNITDYAITGAALAYRLDIGNLADAAHEKSE